MPTAQYTNSDGASGAHEFDAEVRSDGFKDKLGTGAAPFPNGIKQTGYSYVEVNTGNGFGSTNVKIRRFSNIVQNIGTDITYADSATLGGSFTVNSDGIYSISYIDRKDGGTAEIMGITINGNGVNGIAAQLSSSVIHDTVDPTAEPDRSVTVVTRLVAGDVVRAHVDLNSGGYTTQSAGRNQFRIACLFKV